MKKIILSVACLVIISLSCHEKASEVQPKLRTQTIDMSDFYVYTFEPGLKDAHVGSGKCASMKVLNRQLIENPGLEKRMYNIEKHIRGSILAKSNKQKGKPVKDGETISPAELPYSGSITIPVIFNILEDANHHVSLAHINSQIDILNEDFNDYNPATGAVPAEFNNLVANIDITFVLVAVNRKASTKSSWGTNNSMKDSSQNGMDAIDPANNLNIWVCEIGGGILGYAQFPGGDSATDGVVIGSDFVGENAAGGDYGHGRTATHEIGHWLNLRHIWGDGACRQDDFVADTPSSNVANYGCPTYPTVNCNTNDMTMNYMDYVNDKCMYMFTNGQNARIRALFAKGGSKEEFVK